jgi:hypothetical protein
MSYIKEVPDQTGNAGKYLKTDGSSLSWDTIAGGGDMLSSNNLSDVANVSTARTNLGLNTTANQTDSTDKRFMSDAQEAKLDAILGTNTGDETNATIKTKLGITTLSGSNTGDQTSIVGISGTKAQFDTACSDGNFLYSGDVTQYTDEMAQDAVGAMVDSTIIYTDATPLLSRAALTGAITASAGSNTTSLGSFTKSQLDTAVSDGNVMYVGDQPSLSYASAFATATTSISAATYADITGCSVSLAAGTWIIFGHVVAGAANLIIQGFVAITHSDNTVIAASAFSRPASGTASLNSPVAVSWSAIVTPGSTTTYKLRAARGLTTHTSTYTVYDGTGYNTTNHATDNSDKGTSIIAIRIA